MKPLPRCTFLPVLLLASLTALTAQAQVPAQKSCEDVPWCRATTFDERRELLVLLNLIENLVPIPDGYELLDGTTAEMIAHATDEGGPSPLLQCFTFPGGCYPDELRSFRIIAKIDRSDPQRPTIVETGTVEVALYPGPTHRCLTRDRKILHQEGRKLMTVGRDENRIVLAAVHGEDDCAPPLQKASVSEKKVVVDENGKRGTTFTYSPEIPRVPVPLKTKAPKVLKRAGLTALLIIKGPDATSQALVDGADLDRFYALMDAWPKVAPTALEPTGK